MGFCRALLLLQSFDWHRASWPKLAPQRWSVCGVGSRVLWFFGLQADKQKPCFKGPKEVQGIISEKNIVILLVGGTTQPTSFRIRLYSFFSTCHVLLKATSVEGRYRAPGSSAGSSKRGHRRQDYRGGEPPAGVKSYISGCQRPWHTSKATSNSIPEHEPNDLLFPGEVCESKAEHGQFGMFSQPPRASSGFTTGARKKNVNMHTTRNPLVLDSLTCCMAWLQRFVADCKPHGPHILEPPDGLHAVGCVEKPRRTS